MRTKSISQRDFSTRRLGSSRGGQTLQRRTGGAPYVILGTSLRGPQNRFWTSQNDVGRNNKK